MSVSKLSVSDLSATGFAIRAVSRTTQRGSSPAAADRNLNAIRPTLRCEDCSETIYMPEWSEFVSAGRVRHSWRCDACGSRFETTFRLEAA